MTDGAKSSSTEIASTTRKQASAIAEITSTVQEIRASAERVAQRAHVAENAFQAAQAGEAGKCILPTADEVRSLSEPSQQAPTQLKVILGDVLRRRT